MRRFRKGCSRHLRNSARLILGATAIMTFAPLFCIKNTQAVQMNFNSQQIVRKMERLEKSETTTLPEPTVLIVFQDESEQYPFSGHGTTLDQWSNVPEWDIPQEFKDTGGCLPESVRVYLYNLCLEKKLSYPLMLALIEAESGYKWDSSSHDGTCKGYCMIADKWHYDRMERLGVNDIYNPYQNISVSVDYIVELFEKYQEVHQVLMCYNCGESRAKEMWSDGIADTSYSRKIVRREAEISQEIYGY